VLGYIVDGGCRDVELCVSIGFQVYCRYFTPVDVAGHWLPEAFDVPVIVGEVTVHPGDYVLGDDDGVCVIPAARVEEVVDAAHTAVATENTMRDAIRGGMDPQQAYLKYGKF
jgi:regulator of RNase E activity RraA